MARLANLNTSRPRAVTRSGPSAQASWFPAMSRSSWRAAPTSSGVTGSLPTRSPRHQRSSTPAAAMAPSTVRSRSCRPCTSEQTPILTEHHCGFLRRNAVGGSPQRDSAARRSPARRACPWPRARTPLSALLQLLGEHHDDAAGAAYVGELVDVSIGGYAAKRVAAVPGGDLEGLADVVDREGDAVHADLV